MQCARTDHLAATTLQQDQEPGITSGLSFLWFNLIRPYNSLFYFITCIVFLFWLCFTLFWAGRGMVLQHHYLPGRKSTGLGSTQFVAHANFTGMLSSCQDINKGTQHTGKVCTVYMRATKLKNEFPYVVTITHPFLHEVLYNGIKNIQTPQLEFRPLKSIHILMY